MAARRPLRSSQNNKLLRILTLLLPPLFGSLLSTIKAGPMIITETKCQTLAMSNLVPYIYRKKSSCLLYVRGRGRELSKVKRGEVKWSKVKNRKWNCSNWVYYSEVSWFHWKDSPGYENEVCKARVGKWERFDRIIPANIVWFGYVEFGWKYVFRVKKE